MLGEPIGCGGHRNGCSATDVAGCHEQPLFDGAASTFSGCSCRQWAVDADLPAGQEFDVLLPWVCSSSYEFQCGVALELGCSALDRLRSIQGGNLRFSWGGFLMFVPSVKVCGGGGWENVVLVVGSVLHALS